MVILPLFAWRLVRLPPQPRDQNSPNSPLRSPAKYALRDLLLFIVLAAAFCTLLFYVPMHLWHGWLWILIFGIGFGVVTLIGTWAALGRGVRWLRLLLVCIVPWAWPTALWLWTWRRWTNSDQLANPPHYDKAARLTSRALALVLLLPPVWTYAILVHKTPIPQEKFPEKNAYPMLIDAGKSAGFVLDPNVSYPPNPTQLRQAAKAVAPDLTKARRAMQEPCWVPIVYEPQGEMNAYTIDVHERSQALAALTFAFLAEGEAALFDGHTDDAQASYRDLFLLARNVSRGGLNSDWWFAFECERFAMTKMYQIRQQLTAEQCDEWIRLLYEQTRVLESNSITARRNSAFSDRRRHWLERLRWRFWEMTRNRSHGPIPHERLGQCRLALILQLRFAESILISFRRFSASFVFLSDKLT
jgi:hypothetical protein